MKTMIVEALSWVVWLIERTLKLLYDAAITGLFLGVLILYWIVFGGPLISLTP